MVPISLTFACIFALFALVLSFRAGSYRGKTGISILYGSPENSELAVRVRAHQNFLEYVPLILILMAGIEANGGSATMLCVVGTLLIVARIAHAIGLKKDDMSHIGRFIGAGGTALVTLFLVVYGLWLTLPGMMG